MLNVSFSLGWHTAVYFELLPQQPLGSASWVAYRYIVWRLASRDRPDTNSRCCCICSLTVRDLFCTNNTCMIENIGYNMDSPNMDLTPVRLWSSYVRLTWCGKAGLIECRPVAGDIIEMWPGCRWEHWWPSTGIPCPIFTRMPGPQHPMLDSLYLRSKHWMPIFSNAQHLRKQGTSFLSVTWMSILVWAARTKI